MKKIISIILLIVSYSSINAQENFFFKSEDGKVSAQNFIAFDEGVDSLIIKNRKHIFKFSYHQPLIKVKDSEGYDLFYNSILARNIKKIKRKVYLIVGYKNGGGSETELHLIFIKRNKILKYYVLKSYDKRLIDVTFEYLSKTKEVIIPITKQYTPQDYIYEVDLKNNKLDTIKPLTEKKIDSLYYHYKLKIK